MIDEMIWPNELWNDIYDPITNQMMNEIMT